MKEVVMGSGKKRRWTDEQLIVAVANSVSYSEVIKKLGLSGKSNGNYATVKKYIRKLDINTSHLLGKCHGTSVSGVRELSDVLVENSDYSRKNLKKRLLKEGMLENKCQECGQNSEWNGKELVLVLDHINGVHNDNRLDNLRFLCPNCNSQQPTFCKGIREKKSIFVPSVVRIERVERRCAMNALILLRENHLEKEFHTNVY
jgi:Zn finger protein HypA/HybF involved in hydrogenase expression